MQAGDAVGGLFRRRPQERTGDELEEPLVVQSA